MKLHLVLDPGAVAVLAGQSLLDRSHKLSWLSPDTGPRLTRDDPARDWCMLELVLPNLQGLGWIAKFRQAHPLTVIVVSDVENPMLAEQAYGAGADAFLNHSAPCEELMALAFAHVRWHVQSAMARNSGRNSGRN